MINLIWIILFGVFILLVILGKIEKKFRRKFLLIKKRVTYRIRLRKLKDSKIDCIKTINCLNEIARDFFAEFFGLEYKMDYSELKEKFERMNKPNLALFCEQMLLVYYSPEKVTPERAKTLINLLSKIIEETEVKDGQKEIMQKFYFPEGEIEKEEVSEKIDALLIEGHRLLNENNVFMAKKIYEKIKNLYPLSNLLDKNMHQRIIIFYRRILEYH